MPLRVDLDLTATVPESVIRSDVPSLWRYAAVLPVDGDDAVTLGEGWTPLHEVDDSVWVKDEAVNPTGSFKARGMSMAVSAAAVRGVRRLVAPSAGNAAVALAAYGREAGVPVVVAMPEDTPRGLVEECQAHGAQVHLVAGSIADAGRWVAGHREPGDFDVSTLREPYRVEGKKTMAYEIFEQFGGDIPDVVVYPTGGGTGLVGMWKAWMEMRRMGWISHMPRLVSAQAAGCAPVVRAFLAGDGTTTSWDDPSTSAYGLRVPAPIGGFICVRAIRETGGTAVAVSETDLHAAAASLGGETGLDVGPEGGAAWAAYRVLRASGWVADGWRTVVFNTGAGSNYA